MTGDVHPNAMADEKPTDLVGRDGNGRYARTIDTVQRDAEAAGLKSKGYTYRQIAGMMNIDTSTAHLMVKRALHDVIAEPAEELRAIEVDRLDAILVRLDEMRETVLAVLGRKHYAISNGRLMYMPGKDGADDDPLEDDDVTLRAVAQLTAIEDRRIKVQERRAKLLGLDIPVKQEVELNAGVEYRIIGVNIGALS